VTFVTTHLFTCEVNKCSRDKIIAMSTTAATQVFLDQTHAGQHDLFSSPGKRNFVFSLALVLLTILAYYPVRNNNSFINFDDNQYIIRNSQIKSGFTVETLKWAFTSYDAANWHPLTWLSHALDYQMFGMNPVGHHFMSVLFHAVNAVLLFLLLQALGGSAWTSLLLAALFAVHPLNVESVAWAAERKNVLSMFFFLLAVLAYCSYVRRPSVWRYLGVGGLFALALMSKPQVITLPFVLLLLDYWPLRRTKTVTLSPDNIAVTPISRSWLSLVSEKIPLFVLSAASAIVTLYAQRSGHAVRTVIEYSFASRVENAVVSYLLYVRDVFFPRHLAPIYPHPAALMSTWKFLLASSALIALSVSAVVMRKRAPYLLFGWLWFVGNLVPMIGLVQVGEQARADRYMYIAMIGLLVAAVWGISELCDRFNIPSTWRASLSVLALVALSIATYHQVTLWRTSEGLWNYTLSVTQDNFTAEDNLAQELAVQGRTEEALVHFHHILSMHNWRASDLIAFGLYEQRHGYTADAIKQYQHAFENSVDPSTRASAMNNIGSAYMDLKDESRARASFDAALQIDPNYAPALLGSGVLAQKNGDLEFAIREYAKSVVISPSDLGYELLARALEQEGKSSEASDAYKRAQLLSSDYQNTRSIAEHLLAN
jgi:protein O-mannosyl-transferase